MYEYRCEVLRVIDGDTVVANVDLGFSVNVEEKFRLGGIDAPEISRRSPDGHAAKQHLSELINRYAPLLVRVEKRRGKWGRWIGWFYNDTGSTCLNRQMVADGHATYWS